MANRSPSPTSKTNDFPGLFDDIWGVRGRLPRPILGIPGVRAGIKNMYIFSSFQKAASDGEEANTGGLEYRGTPKYAGLACPTMGFEPTFRSCVVQVWLETFGTQRCIGNSVF